MQEIKRGADLKQALEARISKAQSELGKRIIQKIADNITTPIVKPVVINGPNKSSFIVPNADQQVKHKVEVEHVNVKRLMKGEKTIEELLKEMGI